MIATFDNHEPRIGDTVYHISDKTSRGVVTAFNVRGKNLSYEVQWGIEKSLWHLDLELKLVTESDRRIGFTK